MRQRNTATAILGLLTGRQTFFVEKVSQLIIRESSDSAHTSNDDELSDFREEAIETFKKMAFSVD